METTLPHMEFYATTYFMDEDGTLKWTRASGEVATFQAITDCPCRGPNLNMMAKAQKSPTDSIWPRGAMMVATHSYARPRVTFANSSTSIIHHG